MSSKQREFFVEKYVNIRDLPDLGPATAASLEVAGYTTVRSIATASVRELTEIQGISDTSAEKFIKEAGKTMDLGFQLASTYAESIGERESLSFGAPGLDSLVEGGIPTNSITELFGEFGAGKTQITHQLAVVAQLPLDKGGLNTKVLYIDVESVFQPEKIIAIGKRFGVKNPLNGIILAEAFTSDHQCQLLEYAERVIEENKIRLIIIDGVMSHFRSEYIGRESLAPRQQKLNKHLHRLVRLLRQYNAVGVLTNQVSAKPDAYAFHPMAIGGHILAHKAHTIIFLRKVGKGGKRIAEVTASPFFAANTQVPYEIRFDGIHGDQVVAPLKDGDQVVAPPEEEEEESPEEFSLEEDLDEE